MERGDDDGTQLLDVRMEETRIEEGIKERIGEKMEEMIEEQQKHLETWKH